MGKISSKINLHSINWKAIVAFVATLLLGVVAGSGIALNFTPEGEVTVETNYSIELSDEQVPTVIETSDGQVEVIEAPTVEAIDGNQLIDEEGDYGRGEYHDTSTPEAYKNATIGKCTDVDYHYGAQCFDLASDYWSNYAGRWLSSCGTGAAKGTLNCYEQNAGNEFEMIWDPTQLQPGDWVVFTNGLYGHIGMALGSYNNGYIALLGQNQGGTKCDGGGSTANIINISLKNFGGAFRPKSYIKQEPVTEPEPAIPVSGCVKWHVERGDTMSKIMLECENTVRYGEAMDAYAKTWYSLIYMPNQSVYDGWHSRSGVGLYAGDDIEHRF